MSQPERPSRTDLSAIDGCIAILESIPAIVLDLENTLRNYGVRDVLAVSTVLQASEMLSRPLAAAIIDTHFAGPAGMLLADDLLNRGVPVVFLNADSGFEPGDAMGRVTVIAKPHEEHELIEALHRALSLR